MLNTAEKNKIIERLLNDPELEMTQHELEEILERELSKPEEEIDAQLVSDVLSLLEEDEPEEAERQAGWSVVDQKLHEQRRGRRFARARRIAACAAVVILCLALTMSAAQAYSWTFLVKLLKPIAETFGIYSSNQENDNIVPSSADDFVYTHEEVQTEQTQFDSLEDFPAEKNGCRILPSWMPERYAFVAGSLYEDEDMAIATVNYQNGDNYVIIDVSFYYSDDSVFSFNYEKTPSMPVEETISGCEVTYYNNAEDERISASWMHENVHYHVAGNLTVDELRRVVESLLDE